MDTPFHFQFAGRRLEFPSEEELRRFLLDAAEHFHEKTGMPRTEIGQRALNDPAFLTQVKEGRNIKLRTWETFLVWLDKHWAATEQTKRRSRER